MKMKKLTRIFLFALAAPFLIASTVSAATQPPGGRLDLSGGLSFEKYITTGNASQMESSIDSISSFASSDSFLAAVKAIDAPIVIVAYTDITCPDCARTIPYVETMHNVNPLITTVYILKSDETRAFVKAQTGKSSTPTIFVTDKDGAVAGDVYVEYPEAVQVLIDASATDEEAGKHRRDLRSGQYNSEIEKDLLKLINSALPELGRRS
jgi:protein-disulfide isomerase